MMSTSEKLVIPDVTLGEKIFWYSVSREVDYSLSKLICKYLMDQVDSIYVINRSLILDIWTYLKSESLKWWIKSNFHQIE